MRWSVVGGGSRQREASEWARNVVARLAPEFPALARQDVAEVAVQALTAFRREPRSGFEFILDDPAVANWRLVQDPDRRDSVQVTDASLPGRNGEQSPVRAERARRLTALVAALD